MCTSFWLSDVDSGRWWLTKRTFGGPEVEWDRVQRLLPEQVNILRDADVREWK